MFIQGGSVANKNGSNLEGHVENMLIALDIKYKKQVKYAGIYNKVSKMDFLLTEHNIAIEVKNQSGGGSVIEKIPYAIESLQKFPAGGGILVLGDIKAIQKSQVSFWDTKGAGCYDYAIQRSKATNGITIVKYPELYCKLQSIIKEIEA